MTLFKKKGTGALILIMCALALIGILIATQYYRNVNKAVDPRIVEAREMYEKYNIYGQANNFDAVFSLMDSIEFVYSSIEHYVGSFEIGVLYNNRSATYLTMAFYHDDYMHDSLVVDSLVNLAENNANTSISIYRAWLEKYNNSEEDKIEDQINPEFFKGLEEYSSLQQEKFLKKRIKEIQEAQVETNRRISVALTNLGVIYRYKGQYETATNFYSEAIELWDQNLTAENNLNLLLGRPLKKRSFIQKLFPPERK